MRVSFVDLRRPPRPEELAELSPRERSRAARFGAADRRRYETAHCALRAEIRDYTGIAGGQLEFVLGQYGKPALAHYTGCRFNLSYGGDHAMIALAYGLEIGADLECVRAIDDVEGLAADYFHPRERSALLTRPHGMARNISFLHGWTRKEACIKAVGYGLALPTNAFFSGIERCSLKTVLSPLGDNRVVSVTSVRDAPAGYVAAWATVAPED